MMPAPDLRSQANRSGARSALELPRLRRAEQSIRCPRRSDSGLQAGRSLAASSLSLARGRSALPSREIAGTVGGVEVGAVVARSADASLASSRRSLTLAWMTRFDLLLISPWADIEVAGVRRTVWRTVIVLRLPS